jgi:branched-subunit amino acid aminotransferase/4-amino-4-deoxychorismate lyase
LIARVSPEWRLPEGARDRGVAIEVAQGYAAAPSSISRFKTLSRLERDLAWRAARARGRYDALLLDAADQVVEGAATNIFFVRGGWLWTPDVSLGALPGVARAIVVNLAEATRIAVQTGAFPLAELESAEEVFLTNALVGVLPVRELDGRRVWDSAPGPMTRTLATAFEALVTQECA